MKKTYLKPESAVWFIYNIWFIYNDMMGMGEKYPKNIYTRKQGKNSPLVALPSIKLEADCFPGRKKRKQAGPTLGRTDS